ncbi:MAG: hypothetical protein IPG49_11585 [Proteobacteria bacterium]|nr:hypothetical protein [Pseudomonadota bacterium]
MIQRASRVFEAVPIRLRLSGRAGIARFAVHRHGSRAWISARAPRAPSPRALAVHALGYVGAIATRTSRASTPPAFAGTSLVGKLSGKIRAKPNCNGKNG